MKNKLKKMMSGVLAALMVALMLPVLGTDAAAADVNKKFISVGDNGYENCLLSMDTIKVTQGLHYGDSIDLGGADTGKDWMYAPVSCKVTYVYTSGTNTVFFQSLDKVNLPGYDEPQYVIFLAMHMENIEKYFRPGQVFAQGEKMVREGNQGILSKGNHIHFSIGIGKTVKTGSPDWYKNSKGEWVLYNHVAPNKAMFLPKGANILRTGGLEWTQIKDYTEESCSLLATVTKVNSKNKAPLHNYPEAIGTVTSNLKKGEMLLLTGKITNAVGNTWYRTANNEFIYSDYVTVDEATTGAIVLANLTLKKGGAYTFKCGKKTLYASGTANGDPLKLGSATGSKAQFKLTFEDGYWLAASRKKNSAVINAYSDHPTSGCKATLYKDVSTPTQGLIFQRADLFGKGYILRLASDPELVLTAKGSAVQFVTYEKGNANQIWTVSK